MLSSGRLPSKELLTRVTRYAVQTVPGTDGAGLTLIEQHRSNIVVVQYGIGEGPCISAAHDGVSVIYGSLGADPRWPRFARAVGMGLHSALSLPLLAPDELVGAMNIYARAKHAPHERAAGLGEFFAAPVAIAVRNAQVLEDTRRQAEWLQNAPDERIVVERALGIVMSRYGVDEGEALARLMPLSENEHVKLVDAAHTLVEEAVRRARSRLQA